MIEISKWDWKKGGTRENEEAQSKYLISGNQKTRRTSKAILGDPSAAAALFFLPPTSLALLVSLGGCHAGGLPPRPPPLVLSVFLSLFVFFSPLP